MNVIQRVVSWSFAAVREAANSEARQLVSHITDQRVVLQEQLSRMALSARRPKAYVTVRGLMYPKGRGGDPGIVHGWTQSIEVDDGAQTIVSFSPYSSFDLERVDVLGPATITHVMVGNMAAVQSPFEAPASVSISARADPGNCIRVTVKGLP